MILFSREPDDIFTLIVQEALELSADQLRELIRYNDTQGFQACYSLTARCFNPELALATVEQLMAVSREDHYYRVTDYHWLILYEALTNFCDIFNDGAREQQGGFLPLGTYRFREIDCEDLVTFFFWDTDFLMPFGVVGRLGEKVRKEMGLADHIFGLAQGWTPHPAELQVERANPKEIYGPGEDELYRPGSTRYPDPPWPL